MKKRFLSVLLCLCMLLTTAPLAVVAADVNVHDGQEFQVVTTLPTTPGKYCLGSDVVIDATWEVACQKDYELCLHGHSIIANGDFDAITVKSNSSYKFILRDYVSGGKITHASGKTGRGIYSVGRVEMYGGNITGNTLAGKSADDMANGAGVCNWGIFTMYGGTVSENKIIGDCKSNYGAGVYSHSYFYLHDGTITKNTITETKSGSAALGGGIASNHGKLYIYGGTISNNAVGNAEVASSSGGGVLTTGNGLFEMTGGTISGNKSTYYGGGISSGCSSGFKMTGGTVTGNEAGRTGGGIAVERPTEISGGTITNNVVRGSSSLVNGGGVMASGSYVSLKLSGNPVIYGNKTIAADRNNEEAESNVRYDAYFTNSNKFINIGTMTAGAKVGIGLRNTTDLAEGGAVTLSTATTQADVDAFHADNAKTEVFFDSSDSLMKIKLAGLYNLAAQPSENGSVKLESAGIEATNAYSGEKVVVKPEPASGYVVDTVSYNDGEDHVITKENNEYSFIMPKANVTVSVTFRQVVYTVAFNANGGSGTMEDQIIYEGEETALNDNAFTREYYIFKGWSATKNGNVEYADKELVKDLKNPGELLTLYAVWEAEYKEYLITSDDLDHVKDVLNGIADVTKDADNVVHIKLTSDVKGRICLDDNNGNFVVDLNGRTINPGNRNEALCLDNDFSGSVTLTGEGLLKKGSLNVTYKSYSSKLYYALAEGMDYFTLKDGTDNIFDKRNTETKEFTEQYTGNNTEFRLTQAKFGIYTVVFNANGGSGTMADQSIYNDEETALSENVFTKENYTFVGWSETPDGDAEYADKEQVINLKNNGETITLYAVWEAQYKEYLIKSDDLDHVKEVLDGVADVTKDDDGVVYIRLTSDVKGRIRYDYNSGNFVMNLNGKTMYAGITNEAICLDNEFYGKVTLTGDGTIKKGVNNVVYVGYDATLEFAVEEGKGYYTLTDGTNNLLAEKNIAAGNFEDISCDCCEEYILTQGVFAPHTITLSANGGEVEPATLTTGVDGRLASLPAPTISGRYTFDGWFTEAEGGTQITTETFFESDATIYAHWTRTGGGGIEMHIVKFETNGGNVVSNRKVAHNYKITGAKTPVKEGYVFEGWYEDKALTKPFDLNTRITENCTLYAKWTETEAEDDESDNSDVTHICPSKAYEDLDVTKWYHEDTDYVIENGIFVGIGEKTFAPDVKVTRAMFVTCLYRMEGEPATNRSIPFADIDMGAYYASAVTWAKQTGVVAGISETEFAPDDNITREQIAAMLKRYAQYKGFDVSVGDNTNILSYEDFDEISDYAISSMQYACGSGLIKGRTESTLNPKENATRVEIAALLHRFMELNK